MKRYPSVHGIISAYCLLLIAALQCNLRAAEISKADGVINAEASGKPIDRRVALSNASDDISQWQSGRVLVDGKWGNIEDLQAHKLSPQIEAYRKQRDSQELDVEGHRRMARWCKEHQLPEMATVHWKAVVATAVDDEQARKALGHKRIGNDWLSAEELRQAAEDQKREKSDMKEWMPIVRKIIAKLQSADTQTKLTGMKDLDKINAVTAVPALKYGVFQLEPTLALSFVSKIKSIRSKSSCLALCEIAISNPNSEVGRLAVDGLRQYDEHYYVPELLQMLEVPTSLKQEVKFENGSLVVRRAYLRETMTNKEQTEIVKLVSGARDQQLGLTVTGLIKLPGMREFLYDKPQFFDWTIYFPQTVESLSRLANVEYRDAELKMAILNDLRAQRESNIKSVLASISGLPANEPAEEYWNWWPNFNENFTSYIKPTAYRSGLDNSNYAQVTRYNIDTKSCLIAGTPIQTSDGLRPIEELKIGDMVASINATSGETSLRPIVYTSNRIADATYIFTTDTGETIRATGGHYWWIVGKGWLRTRELQVGQFMRTGHASVEIKKIEKIDTPIKVYNLIIDESHTYLVGKNRLLSWDLSALQPTLQTAPGQTNHNYAALK